MAAGAVRVTLGCNRQIEYLPRAAEAMFSKDDLVDICSQKWEECHQGLR